MSNATSANRRPPITSWLPVLAWAAVIFIFSGEAFSGANTAGTLEPLLRNFFPALSGVDIALIHIIIRKLGHFAEYFILAMLVLRAFRHDVQGKLSPRRLALGIALTALYAASDELHQAFVPNRTAGIADLMLDVFGGICATLWFHLRNNGKIVR
jgi:VanZ family protein